MERSRAAERSEPAPTTMRSGWRKSPTAEPSRRNSGLETTFEGVRIDAVALQGAANPLVGVDRDGALFDDHFVTGDGVGDLGDDRLDGREIGCAVVALGRSDGDKDRFALLDGAGQVGGEDDTVVAVAGEQPGQVFFEDGHAALAKEVDFGLVLVDA